MLILLQIRIIIFTKFVIAVPLPSLSSLFLAALCVLDGSLRNCADKEGWCDRQPAPWGTFLALERLPLCQWYRQRHVDDSNSAVNDVATSFPERRWVYARRPVEGSTAPPRTTPTRP